MNPVRSMLFDLDGTLLDSAPDLVASLNHVRQAQSLAPLPVAGMSRFASKGAVGLLKNGMPRADEATFQSWRQLFLRHYADNSCNQSSLFDGIPELLDVLDDSGMPWGVVTNKPEALTWPIIEAMGLVGRAACVVGGDTLSQSKPHPAPVSLACGIIGTVPEETLMVGDDIRDIEAGRAAGTQTAAVYYGYGSHEFTGDVVDGSLQVHHPIELAELVRQARAVQA
jgi:phosphoglycolate phosphatase